jgi:hypothetical protein
MALTPKIPFRFRRLAPQGRTARIIDTTAVAATSAFAGGALVSQTVIVPGWRAMDPVAFLRLFATYGPITGATVFPFELASVLLLAITTFAKVTSRWPGRLLWALAMSGMVGTLVLLIYFVPTNLGMLDPAFPAQAVPAELTTWYRWNWVRTGLGVASAVVACIALTVSRRGEDGTAMARGRG